MKPYKMLQFRFLFWYLFEKSFQDKVMSGTNYQAISKNQQYKPRVKTLGCPQIIFI